MEDVCVRRILQPAHSGALEKSQAGCLLLECVVLLLQILRSGGISVRRIREKSLDHSSSLSFNCNTGMTLGTDQNSDFPREIKTWMWGVRNIGIQIRAPILWFFGSLLPNTTSNSFLFTFPNSATLGAPSFVRIFSAFYYCWWVQLFIPLPCNSQFWVLVLNPSIYRVGRVPSWPTPCQEISQVCPNRNFATGE